MAVEPQQMQYVLADCDSMGNNVYQLDNGQIIQATAIGQPIPICKFTNSSAKNKFS